MTQGIALIGEPGSGKSYIAKALAALLGWKKLSFAGPLKDEVAAALALTDVNERPLSITIKTIRAEMDNPDTKDKYRGILQWWGTEYRRASDPNYWLKQFEKAMGFGVTGENFTVDDCRFDNELELLLKYNFKIVYLEPGETTRSVPEHGSEVDWKNWAPHLTLSYEKGPEHQAERIIQELDLVESVVKTK